jgi:polyisoprenoid-binding protein YceI
MLSDQLLDAEKFPTISFRSTSFKRLTPATAEIRGELSLHGTVRTLEVTVGKADEVYTGWAKLKQTDYGMKPVFRGRWNDQGQGRSESRVQYPD